MGKRIQNVTPIECKGIKYRSTLEAETARILAALGIKAEYEPFKFELVSGFKCRYQKDKVQSITYTPDFIIDNIILECKGFETPEWKIKKKLLFRHLEENNLDYTFIQTRDCRKSLIEALDGLWLRLGFAVLVLPKPTKKNAHIVARRFSSVREAMDALGIVKPIGSILRSLTGKTQYVYGYEWKLVKINI